MCRRLSDQRVLFSAAVGILGCEDIAHRHTDGGKCSLDDWTIGRFGRLRGPKESGAGNRSDIRFPYAGSKNADLHGSVFRQECSWWPGAEPNRHKDFQSQGPQCMFCEIFCN